MTTRANDMGRSLAAVDEHSTLLIVAAMGQKRWLVAGLIPGVERHAEKKTDPDPEMLFRLLERWRGEAAKARRPITRIAVAYEGGRDGFWLAPGLRAAASRRA
jgi:transposase